MTKTITLDSIRERAEEQEIEARSWEDTGQSGEAEAVALPRADGGKDAWMFLAACFTIEALVWGTSSVAEFLALCRFGSKG